MPSCATFRKAREQRGLSQQELAIASNGELKLRTISNYESAAYTSERKRSTVRSWALVTGVPFDWLWTGAVSQPDGGEPSHTGQYRPTLATVVPLNKAA
jgi:transcriptional regulator with XRE-family HTH domain